MLLLWTGSARSQSAGSRYALRSESLRESAKRKEGFFGGSEWGTNARTFSPTTTVRRYLPVVRITSKAFLTDGER